MAKNVDKISNQAKHGTSNDEQLEVIRWVIDMMYLEAEEVSIKSRNQPSLNALISIRRLQRSRLAFEEDQNCIYCYKCSPALAEQAVPPAVLDSVHDPRAH
jgi:hypothetical protein